MPITDLVRPLLPPVDHPIAPKFPVDRLSAFLAIHLASGCPFSLIVVILSILNTSFDTLEQAQSLTKQVPVVILYQARMRFLYLNLNFA